MPMFMIGGSLAAFTYLGFKVSDMNRNKMKYMAEGHTYMSPLVQQRVAHTLGYFSYGILATAGTVYALRNSMVWASIPWWGFFLGSLGMMYATMSLDYERAYPLKLAAFTGFAGVTGMIILPLVQMSSYAAIADAALATGLSMGSLTGIAYMAPSEQFLNWGGPLSMAGMGMFCIGLASMFYPQSRALHNIWLYGGLGLTGMFTMYHVQAIMYMAKTQQNYDPLGNCVGIYNNAINFFIRFLLIMGGRKNK